MLFRYRLLCANLVVLIAVFGVFWGREIENAPLPADDFLARLEWRFRNWRNSRLPVSPSEAALLQADSIRMERFAEKNGNWIEMTVIAGHRKQSIHTPAYCLRGDGWEVVAEETVTLPVAGHEVQAVRARISKGSEELLATYFFTDGTLCTPSLMRFQTMQMVRRLGTHPPLGALVRILTPVRGSRDAAASLTDELAKAVLPATLSTLNQKRVPGV
jgi:EpsI family protein